jgi:N-methylhydantoinase A
LEQPLRIGVDIGGTFTDLVRFDDSSGELRMEKSFTTPEELTRAVFTVVDSAANSLEPVARFVHGTTAGTNAVLERKGARVGLLTTKGFRDTLEIMRINREHHYDLQWSKPEPLVPRRYRYEVRERIDYRGRVVVPIDEEELRGVVARMRNARIESIAVCFLFSFMNASHERRARDIIAEMWSDVPVSVSSEILPEIREYERASTVVIDAFVKPLLGKYFHEIEAGLRRRGLAGAPTIMGSGGGTVPVQEASSIPVKTLQSGPAGGVIGSAYVGSKCGYDQLIAIDVGGTSFEVSVIDRGRANWTSEGSIEWGIPFKIPLVDVKSIGAGGGSIARVDPGGLIQVGPKSAGADPGPACYGRGGDLPTLTDAYLVIGAISPDYFLGGRVKLDYERAAEAIEKHVASQMGMDVPEAAMGIIAVARASMVGAMEVVSTQRGYDPRDYSLMAYGGAGPLIAVELAREMAIGRVIVPRFPGAFCAFGMLCADVRFDFVRSYYRRASEAEASVLNEIAGTLEGRAKEALSSISFEGKAVLRRTADLRYVGQNFEVNVPVPDGTLDDAAVSEITARFNDEHYLRFGHRKLDEPVEFVSLRITGFGLTNKPRIGAGAGQGEGRPKAHRQLRLTRGDETEVLVYERDELYPGWRGVGPLIVEEPDSTMLCGTGDEIEIDDSGNMVVAVASAAGR